jgi:hypothetical protein
MMKHPFALVPFADPEIPEVRITGDIMREGNVLVVQYSLSGNIQDVLLPEINPQPARKGELWLQTCFEFFLAFPDQPQYWEFNFSPSGDWNVFHMDAYRRFGFSEEKSMQAPVLEIRNNVDCFTLDATIDLSPIAKPESQIQVGITSVIQAHQGHETYWALAHPQPQADFHLRDGFILTL